MDIFLIDILYAIKNKILISKINTISFSSPGPIIFENKTFGNIPAIKMFRNKDIRKKMAIFSKINIENIY